MISVERWPDAITVFVDGLGYLTLLRDGGVECQLQGERALPEALHALLHGDRLRRPEYDGVRGRARWVQEGIGFARPNPRRWWRPLCWVAGSHVWGCAWGDDDGCLICAASEIQDLEPAWWELP